LWEFGSNLLGPVPQGGSAFATPTSLISAQSATLPKQVVDQSGMIMVPFAGDISAVGRTTHEVQSEIIAALRGKANNTQALVQIEETTDNAVTVTGDVNHPGRFPLALNGTRLLDAVSFAGGTTGKAREMVVQLSRGGEVRGVRLSAALSDPAQNIYLRPGDMVSLDQEPQSVVVLGATNKNAEVTFGKSRITLAEAIGNGGGLTDHQADPYGVYVLRNEKTTTAERLRADPIPEYMTVGDTVPVIYHVNMKSVDGMLLAQNFTMQDRDVVYVANSPSVQLSKIAAFLNNAAAIFKGNSLNNYTY
jgi:polysaccharide export outer membrane protein